MTSKGLISRRNFVASAGAMSLCLPAGPIWAAAEQKKAQAPGFFRFQVGKFEATMLSDGLNQTPFGFSASNVSEQELKTYLNERLYPTDARLSHLNVCLINTGESLVLVDTGSGDNFRETAGKLTESLEASGYALEDVDTVIITHGHPDHIWGIIDDFAEEPRFPNARYFINEAEWDYWTSDDLASRLPEGFHFFATGAHRNLKPVADLTTRVKPGAEIVPGIHIIDSPGHTLGHVSVVASSGNDKLLVTGDAITHPFISLEHPEWEPQMDMEKAVAVETRKRLIDMAAADKMIVASYHIPFPGVGHIARIGTTYRWLPLTWQWEL
ncbi:MAG: MBL fold metallo-hydrolase [Pseudomonadota bacterium]